MLRKALPVLLTAAAAAVPAAAGARPATDVARLPLPQGLQPEGIAAAGGQLYVGSISTGAVLRLDPDTGLSENVVPPADDSSAIGVEATSKYLAVAAGDTGSLNVYRRSSGNFVTGFSTPKRDTFVNDVARIGSTFYATDSRQKVLLTVKPGQKKASGSKIDLTGVPYGKGLNLNGIEAAGKQLIAVHTTNGNLYRISRDGAGAKIDLGGAKLKNGDGLLLEGRTLYVVQNQDNQIAVVKLNAKLTRGRVKDTITSTEFDVPTTLTRSGKDLFAVNARFGIENPEDADYWVTRFR